MKKIYFILTLLCCTSFSTNAQSQNSLENFWGIPFGSNETDLKRNIQLKSKGVLLKREQDGKSNFYRLWYTNIEFAKKQSDIFFELQDDKFVSAIIIFNNKNYNTEKLKELFNDIKYSLDKKYFSSETLWNKDCEWRFKDNSFITLSISNNRSIILRYTYKTYYEWLNKQVEIIEKENNCDY